MCVHRASRIVLLRRDSWKSFFIIGIRTNLFCPMEKKSHPRATLYGQRTEFIDILPTGRGGADVGRVYPVGAGHFAFTAE